MSFLHPYRGSLVDSLQYPRHGNLPQQKGGWWLVIIPWLLLLAVMALILFMGGAKAAEITAKTEPDSEFVEIYIQGEICPCTNAPHQEDGDKFIELTKDIKYHGAIVYLAGPGGNLLTAFQIGATIREKAFGTVVVDTMCVSACAFIWVAGNPPMAAPYAAIGFHQASQGDESSGVGNALVGAYLRDLNFGLEAIAYMTKASPSGVTYLNKEDADKVGIKYEILNGKGPGQQSAPRAAAPKNHAKPWPKAIDIWCTPNDDPNDHIHTWAVFDTRNGNMTQWQIVHNIGNNRYNRWSQYTNFSSVHIVGVFEWQWSGDQIKDRRYHMDATLVHVWVNQPDHWEYSETVKLNGVIQSSMVATCK